MVHSILNKWWAHGARTGLRVRRLCWCKRWVWHTGKRNQVHVHVNHTSWNVFLYFCQPGAPHIKVFPLLVGTGASSVSAAIGQRIVPVHRSTQAGMEVYRSTQAGVLHLSKPLHALLAMMRNYLCST